MQELGIAATACSCSAGRSPEHVQEQVVERSRSVEQLQELGTAAGAGSGALQEPGTHRILEFLFK